MKLVWISMIQSRCRVLGTRFTVRANQGKPLEINHSSYTNKIKLNKLNKMA